MPALQIPTFEEYKRNRARFLGRDDDALAQVEKGSVVWNHLVKKHIYEIGGHRCKTLEEVERVAASKGIPLRELDYRPHFIPQGAGKADILVRFLPTRRGAG